jgi:hypothetical protein
MTVALVETGRVDRVAVAVFGLLLPRSHLTEAPMRLPFVFDDGVGGEAGDGRVEVSGVAGGNEEIIGGSVTAM